ncbi:MAG: molybdopterin converting factor subunit 1 [Candidatus Dormibacteraceae bacterium]
MIKVRLFARLREQAGIDCLELELHSAKTVAEVYDQLKLEYPALNSDLSAILPACNLEPAEWDRKVADGDEIAFLPPLSGG